MNQPDSRDDNQKRFIELEREQAEDTGSAQPEEQRLLEEVLQETMAATSGPEAYALVLLVAKRPGNEDITNIHTAEELVREILSRRMPRWVAPGDLLRHVAEMLLEDPVARERLVGLWAEATNDVG
ncbi:MAG: hypothetical protein ACI9HK_000118 [Pirellulaceae bacterium]|jgi:hypothetical protein